MNAKLIGGFVQFGLGCSSGIKRTSASRVIAYEPSSEYEGTFTRNLKMNLLGDNVRLMRIRKSVGTEANDTVRLDAMKNVLELSIFLRIDVDGAEMEVLEGATGLLEMNRIRLLIETHSPKRKLGYRTRIVNNAFWRALLMDQRPIELNRWLVASNDPNFARMVDNSRDRISLNKLF